VAQRVKSDWVVEVEERDSGERSIYGPYTERQARRAQAEILGEIEARRVAEDEDEHDSYTCCYPLHRWAPSDEPTPEAAPRRPACPACGERMKAWSSEFTDESFASCRNERCGRYRCEERVAVRDGAWVIVDRLAT
jgi:hypothetical protein